MLTLKASAVNIKAIRGVDTLRAVLKTTAKFNVMISATSRTTPSSPKNLYGIASKTCASHSWG